MADAMYGLTLKRAQGQMKALRQLDHTSRSQMRDNGMDASLHVLEQINPGYVFERIQTLAEEAARGKAPTANEVDAVQEIYRQLMDQLSAFKLGFDEELVKKGAERSVITDVLVSQGAKLRKPLSEYDVWRRTQLGQCQEHVYGLISNTGQQAGLVARTLELLRTPPTQAAGSGLGF